MISIGQELWVGEYPGVLVKAIRRTTLLIHFVEFTRLRENNHSLGTPGGANNQGFDLCERNRLAAGHEDGFQFSIREESNLPPIRRPERESCAVGAWQIGFFADGKLKTILVS